MNTTAEPVEGDQLILHWLLSNHQLIEPANAKSAGKLSRSKGNVLPATEALTRLHEFTYFGPHGRARQGCRADDTEAQGTVLWADIDLVDKNELATLSPEDLRQRKRRVADQLTETLAQVGVSPALIVDSAGKGIQLFLKLDRPVCRNTIEDLNKRLALLLDGDHTHDIGRLTRLPGAVNELTSLKARILHFKPIPVDPDHLDRVAYELKPLPEGHAELQRERDRHALKKYLVPNRINVFVVGKILDPNASATTKKAAAWQGFAPSGKLAGAHIEAEGRLPSTYVIVSAEHGSALGLTHELGHFFGVAHHRDPINIMSYGRERERFEPQQLDKFRAKLKGLLRRRVLTPVRSPVP